MADDDDFATALDEVISRFRDRLSKDDLILALEDAAIALDEGSDDSDDDDDDEVA